ncbi:GTP cyclohydrolase II RibA [Geitlerinema splendidum]|nr:GTP cyclohydrolase II RibA [Geitlerinema splendidum]
MDNNSDLLLITKAIKLETKFGVLNVSYICGLDKEGIIVSGEKNFANPIPIRVQSSCLFSESLLSLDCDCASQLHSSLKIITLEGGILIYFYEEGRGAGLLNKIEAIRLQQQHKIDTACAYRELGISADPRNYEMAALTILQLIGNDYEVELITNNPIKVRLLQEAGINIVKRRPLVLNKNSMVEQYLLEKSRILGHILEDNV